MLKSPPEIRKETSAPSTNTSIQHFTGRTSQCNKARKRNNGIRIIIHKQ